MNDNVNSTSNSLMSVHAHPDDETIQTGGVFLRCAEAGIPTVLVCATSGEEGENHDPDLDPIEAQPRLGEIRRGELACAVAKLRIDRVELLGYRDSGMAGTEANAHPESFNQAPLDEAATKLARLIRQHRPTVLLSYPPGGNYGHPDHIKVHQVTRAAYGLAADPDAALADLPPWKPAKLYESTMPRELALKWREEWQERQRKEAEAKRAAGEELAPAENENNEEWFDLERDTTPLDQIAVCLDVREYADQKREALRCHRTQIPADSEFFQTPPDLERDWFGMEYFNRVDVERPGKEADLFEGLS